MKLGIAGLAGAGKSTVFGALTRSELDPGLRSDDRIGTVQVPDERVERLSAMYRPRKTIYARVEYLLPGLSGAKPEKKEQTAWSALRECDGLVNVVRNFTAYGMDPPSPSADFAAFDQELILSDLVAVEKRLERIAQDRQRKGRHSPEEVSLLEACREMLNGETPLRRDPELVAAPLLRGFAFLSAKPMLALFNNRDEDDRMPSVEEICRDETCMVLRGKLEQEMAVMPQEEAREFMAEFEIPAPATDRVIRKSYDALGLISFFTVGEDEVRAWTVSREAPAVEAAGVIHSDMQKGFIRAEVVAYRDLMDAGSYAEARKRGTVRLEGKSYPMQDGDIVNFRFNV
jgi:GTP-binding protein YchF